MNKNVRALAAKCCFSVVDKGRSLGDELPTLQEKVEGKDKALLQEICYGVLRYLPELEHYTRQLIAKPLTGKQRVAHFLILVGIYQLKYMRIPDHAAVAETVNGAKPLKQFHLKNLINGVLRNFQRQASPVLENVPDAITFNHPSWFIKKLQAGYPEQWQQILQANMEKPPMWLRINQQKQTVKKYLARLSDLDIAVQHVDKYSEAVCLSSPIDVNKLPGFFDGDVSIQDGAAQQAAILLSAQAQEHILDCCAAPGGKTCHILEISPTSIDVTALDIDQERLDRVTENLTRLSLNAKTITGDASKSDWWDGKLFDRILLDVPCSGTGVIRRHPDIKWLRKAADIDKLTILQQQILKNVWSLLKPGGTLLYATCSILPEENREQIQTFIDSNEDAQLQPIQQTTQDIGWQILPNEQAMDGFYYAKLKKNNNT
ncbi:16S rRNA (cytosine(967)-C(5))-methyltransferase RsmB [Thalassotalea sp. PP2-459]|uniref:16S rRNA (cytosine(967)-C(5))-methyltransferase RsmB n=1 Tax=Thalassotalea sp. PP2-459 TaxID=1742724 RepID=UPI000944A67A|nr:16S rRNA (cytosine(967)-C(5))-methyltransferase RsmB [Thalassotalea sp. PP2-459]OKY27560.1 16S rRNA (cytosine(967)-C(5))-methyltransferase [Thalassotalea sp. PP2-459]